LRRGLGLAVVALAVLTVVAVVKVAHQDGAGPAAAGRGSGSTTNPLAPDSGTSASSSPRAVPPSPSTAPLLVPSPIPGFLLIADRGNDRMLLVGSHRHVVWRYPEPGVRPAQPFNFDDDAFFTPGWRSIVSNQEDQQTVQVISFPDRRVLWSYGHVDVPSSAPGYLHTPDDAYVLTNGTRVVADIHNCRILFISPDKQVVRQFGTTGVCRHDPPKFLASPNGDTPLPDGGMLVTEINGSWVDRVTASGKLAWSVHAPVSYPSDAQLLPNGHILLADYSNPGHVLIMTRTGNVLFRYGPDSGPGALKYPSLALMLPNGLIAVNDDFRDRVVLIDPRTHRIVWQYGRTDAPGSAPGALDRPDGMDFLPYADAMRIPAIREIVAKG
jgi:hypothetical protein